MKDDDLAHVTGSSLKAALGEWSLKFAADWSFETLALEVRSALGPTIFPKSEMPDRISNVEIKSKLEYCANLAKNLEYNLEMFDEPFENLIQDAAMKIDGCINFIALIMRTDSSYVRYSKMLSDIKFLGEFLDKSAKNIETQMPKWRQKARREQRIFRGSRLIPIFECAFDKKATINSWPSDSRHREKTAFMDFYLRTINLVFEDDDETDLAAILKEARKSVAVRVKGQR